MFALLKQSEKLYWQKVSSYHGFDEETFNLILKNCGKLKLVIEVGCGSGAWTRHLDRVASGVVGIDFSIYLIKEAHKELRNCNCEWILADAEFLPFKGEAADQCFFGFSLHHISNVMQCLEDVARCLRKNGLIMLVEPNGTSFARRFGYRIGVILKKVGMGVSTPGERPINIDGLVKTLQKFGFECEVWPCLATIRIGSVKSHKPLIEKVYISSLKFASFILPNVFGSSDFILIGRKTC